MSNYDPNRIIKGMPYTQYRKIYEREKRLRQRLSSGIIAAELEFAEGIRKTAANRAEAAYDPLRDGYMMHADLTASLMGDPPIGRRAIDCNGNASGRRAIDGVR